MAWGRSDNIAAEKALPLVLIVSDNERSHAPTIGGLAEHLATLRTTRRGIGASWVGQRRRSAHAGRRDTDGARPARHQKGIKGCRCAAGLFEDLGLKYIGPVDGHDPALEARSPGPKNFKGPVIVHVIAQKGRGYEPARRDEADQFHAVGVINRSPVPFEIAGRSWTDEFSDEMVALGA